MVKLTLDLLATRTDKPLHEVVSVDCSSLSISHIEDISIAVNLHKLNLAKNELKSAQALSGIQYNSELTWLHLGANKLESLQGLEKLTNLLVLNVSHNELNRISHHVSSCTKLKALILNHNKIARIENLSTLQELTTIVLSDNKLTQIDGVGGLQLLEKLSAAHNNIRSFPILTNPALRELRLNDNKIITIPESIRKLPSLEILDLGNNLISHLTDLSSLSGCMKLVNLTLKGNPVVQTLAKEEEQKGSLGYKERVLMLVPGLRVLDGERFDPKFLERRAKRKKDLELKRLRLEAKEEAKRLKSGQKRPRVDEEEGASDPQRRVKRERVDEEGDPNIRVKMEKVREGGERRKARGGERRKARKEKQGEGSPEKGGALSLQADEWIPFEEGAEPPKVRKRKRNHNAATRVAQSPDQYGTPNAEEPRPKRSKSPTLVRAAERATKEFEAAKAEHGGATDDLFVIDRKPAEPAQPVNNERKRATKVQQPPPAKPVKSRAVDRVQELADNDDFFVIDKKPSVSAPQTNANGTSAPANEKAPKSKDQGNRSESVNIKTEGAASSGATPRKSKRNRRGSVGTGGAAGGAEGKAGDQTGSVQATTPAPVIEPPRPLTASKSKGAPEASRSGIVAVVEAAGSGKRSTVVESFDLEALEKKSGDILVGGWD
ncbi:hypothetical protein HK104_005604 [Borealophlyctis nickersoniae]|nr:hypothetical protein HK104_005604 [Borealophlyctis nickersoniae]